MDRLIRKLSRGQKTAILLALDSILTLPALLIALQLRLGSLWPEDWIPRARPLFLVLPIAAALLAWQMRIPMVVLRAIENRAILKIGLFATILTLVAIALNAVINIAVPRSVPGIFGALLIVFAVLARLVLLQLMDWFATPKGGKANVVIYGAGASGQQLLGALRGSSGVRAVAFADDHAGLQRLQVGGLPVVAPADLPALVARRNVKRILLAMPSLPPRRRAEITARLAPLGCEVLTLPTIVDLLDGRNPAERLRPVGPGELLNRPGIDLALDETAAAYRGASVMVTGAGGSIGSEICRQILAFGPARLILFENSEFALYSVELDLKPAAGGAEIVPVIGSVTDAEQVADVITRWRPAVILHAAAHKHVPMVEANPAEGVKNNVLGTEILAREAARGGCGRFILISTDKAVRPTSVMGASKRVAEILVQSVQEDHPGTVFSMVRFGNVLGSSGSVIPLFQRQIAEGGPVTLTDDRVTRFFMTIPEAVQLVLVAGSYARGGEVFVLDMGAPVRIRDLAQRMIELSGLTLRDAANPDGDIAIEVTGLRPGEKLYEELLIGEDVIETPHPKIMRARETFPARALINRGMAAITEALASRDDAALIRALSRLVPGFRASLPEAGVPRARLPGRRKSGQS